MNVDSQPKLIALKIPSVSTQWARSNAYAIRDSNAIKTFAQVGIGATGIEGDVRESFDFIVVQTSMNAAVLLAGAEVFAEITKEVIRASA